jgi:osmotically-inducible protein OsmY
MNTPLQSVNLTADDVQSSSLIDKEEHTESEEAHHIHMPSPSLWPFILGLSILIALAGLLVINKVPAITIIGVILAFISILGIGLEDPFRPLGEQAKTRRLPTSYAEAAEVGRPTYMAEALLEDAQDVADRVVTVSSTAWSAHPVKVEVEREGVVLSLYGKVELKAQSEELQDALLRMPGVLDVKNFLVAEDALLNEVNDRIEKLKAAGKLEGARDISALVENYIVSLYGETPTSEMKYMLEREIVGIPGVRVVINHIGLNEDIPGNLGRTNNKIGK